MRTKQNLNLVFVAIAVQFVTGCMSCGEVRENTKEAILETGKTVGKTGSELVQSVSEGVANSLNCKIQVNENLKKYIRVSGKLNFRSENGGNDNVCSIYMIFEEAYSKKINIKVLDENGVEYGRSKAIIAGKKDEATYIDFVFDKRVDLEAKSTFELY